MEEKEVTTAKEGGKVGRGRMEYYGEGGERESRKKRDSKKW